MKLITLVLAAFLFMLTRVFAQDGDYRARYCELFVSQVEKADGHFGAKNLVFFIKTRNERLDGGIKEVGFYYKGTVASKVGVTYEEYRAEKAGKLGPSSFIVELPVEHNDAWIRYTGSFYVKTTNNTTYWLNTHSGEDFIIDLGDFYGLIPFEYNPDSCY